MPVDRLAEYERWWATENPVGTIEHVSMLIGRQWCCTVRFDGGSTDRVWAGSDHFGGAAPKVGDRVRLLNPERILYRMGDGTTSGRATHRKRR